MAVRHPTVSLTEEGLVIRIPWHTVDLGALKGRKHPRHLTVRDVLELVEAGRLAHRLGMTRTVRSLKELAS